MRQEGNVLTWQSDGALLTAEPYEFRGMEVVPSSRPIGISNIDEVVLGGDLQWDMHDDYIWSGSDAYRIKFDF